VTKNKLYLYLARLDKKGIKVLASFPYAHKVYPTRVADVSSLGLSGEVLHCVSSESKENRMTHELYAESSSSFDQLKKSLSSRGYSHLPIQQLSAQMGSSHINAAKLTTVESTMIRRASEVKK